MTGLSVSLYVFVGEIVLAVFAGWGVVLVVRDLMIQLSWVY